MTTTAPRAGDTPITTQQALAEAWAEGHRTGWEHCQDGNYGNDYWDDPTPNPYAQDPEVRAIEALTAVLEPMEPHARHRVLMYLADRWAGGDWPESPMG